MRQLLVSLSLALVVCGLTACGGKQLLRDRVVYGSELQFADNTVAEQHAQLRQFIDLYCLCGDAPQLLCNEAVETWVVVESRWPWHMQMMLYNGAMTDVDPGMVPAVVEYPHLMEMTCE